MAVAILKEYEVLRGFWIERQLEMIDGMIFVDAAGKSRFQFWGGHNP
jgi:hypothetical protein